MKRNWFMTQNNKIVDLNKMSFFWTETEEESGSKGFSVIATDHEEHYVWIGQFESIEEVKAYLSEVYKQLETDEKFNHD
tara:strand:+ start:2473 stop:2709 length:237 start_codon:yes stop_codon:yes gene_type:complete